MAYSSFPPGSPIDWPGLSGADVCRFRVAVIGEIRIDIRTKLADLRFRDLAQDQLTFAPIDFTVSGTATNFAQYALNYFETVNLISKIGQDSFTALIRAKLNELGITAHLAIDANTANGLVIVLHDAAERGATGTRLMIAGKSPAMGLSPNDIESVAESLAQSDALFIDGYALLYERSAQAIRAAATINRASGGIVCFDLVPHDIHKRIPLAALLPVLELSDVIISQADTLAGVFDVASVGSDEATIAHLGPVLDSMTKHNPLWLIRSGPNSIDIVSAYQRGAIQQIYRTGYRPHMPPMGFGDRLTSCELYWLLSTRHGAN